MVGGSVECGAAGQDRLELLGLVVGETVGMAPPRPPVALPGQADLNPRHNRHGIPVRTARNAALAALAADLPSPILAGVTGMHRHIALRWVAYARRDWAEYLAARAGMDR
ncbi:hypothetical protein [Streptomyces sp. NPDC018352]|uniref:hypothetical protein n=1 Tax=Streptomyces sp. NPDC018352 TaxID=3157194 RepID=UPI00340BABA1